MDRINITFSYIVKKIIICLKPRTASQSTKQQLYVYIPENQDGFDTQLAEFQLWQFPILKFQYFSFYDFSQITILRLQQTKLFTYILLTKFKFQSQEEFKFESIKSLYNKKSIIQVQFQTMQSTPSSQNITVKIVLTIILLIVDIILSSFIEINFSTTATEITPFYVNFYLLPIQMFVTFLIVVMMIVLMWQTFPLRYGLIGSLLKEFKWTFLAVVIFIGFTAAERGIKLYTVVIYQKDWNQFYVWANLGYRVLYYLRFLSYPIFYGFIISFCTRIIQPSFYKPNRWLK